MSRLRITGHFIVVLTRTPLAAQRRAATLGVPCTIDAWDGHACSFAAVGKMIEGALGATSLVHDAGLSSF
ncbi:hypothetical protein [Streptomyces sp. NBC_00582]|uniref:hypothetical protein n=1 Tax=Streptomyces sp. NBC_00582 TaxID=2975783 RepID=UPI002E8064D1|nr:hypothetical protein [Streptomyces sp. NBC_00582]WUB67418.1 hypothetical protein OG852_47025 [Streptomyces sp. NBC_00582]